MTPQVKKDLLQITAEPADQATLKRILARSNWHIQVRTTCREAMQFLHRSAIPVIIADAEHDPANWRRVLRESGRLPESPCLIVSSRLADERLWAEVLNLGAYDLLATPFQPEEVRRVTMMAFEFWQREREQAGALL
jgi:DNA-binding response OmpR family regulator